jgi:hypothetical protein
MCTSRINISFRNHNEMDSRTSAEYNNKTLTVFAVEVQSQSVKKAILAALADEEMTKILDSVMYHSKSIVDITKENNIPHTTCYRKTKWLLNEGLVIVDKIIITPEGKKFSLYHSVLKSINVKYESNNVIVEAEQNFDIIKRTMARFYSLE